MQKLLCSFLFLSFFNTILIAEENYKLITFFDLNSGTEKEAINQNHLKYEFFLNNSKKFIRIYDDTAEEIDKRSHFIKEKINLSLESKQNCQSNKFHAKIFAIKNKNNISNILNNFLNNEIDENQLYKQLSHLIEIKNGENFYALDFVLKDYYRSLNNGFLLIDLNECIKNINPKHYSISLHSWFDHLDNKKIYEEISSYYYNKQILKINNKSYNYDQLILKDMPYNSSISDRNFFITNMTASQFQQLKSEGISTLDFTWSNLIHYDGNVILDENNNILKIDSINFERSVSKFVYLQITVIILFALLTLFVYFRKKFPIKIKNYNFYFYFYLVFFILINSYNLFLQKYSDFFVSTATYFISIILFSFIIFILAFEDKLKNE